MPTSYSEHIFTNGLGHLQVEDCDCLDLAARYDTPLYVLSENEIRQNYRTFHSAFAERYPEVITAYGSKANNSLAVRHILTQEGAGAECFGVGELRISLDSGIEPRKVILNGSNKTQEELLKALQAGTNINVDNLEELSAVAEMATSIGTQARINVRLKLPLTSLENEFVKDYRYSPPDISVARWAQEHKFGMHREEALEACHRALNMPNVSLLGIHYHLKGQTTRPDYFATMTREVMEFVIDVKRQLGWIPKQLDLGGGFGYGRDEGYGPEGRDRDMKPIAVYADAITSELLSCCRRIGIKPPTLILEPGRIIVASAGILLTRVGSIKESPHIRKWVHVDASTNHLMRIRTSRWYYHIIVANKAASSAQEVVDVVGPLCDAADILGDARHLPSVERGDLLAVLDTGAYTEVTGCQFNTYPMPATVLVNGHKVDVVSERETLEDLLSRHRVPARLRI